MTSKELFDRAAQLWPASEHNRRAWIRAVRIVCKTKRGWLLDRKLAGSAQ